MQVQVNVRQLFYSYKLLHGMLHVSLMLSKEKIVLQLRNRFTDLKDVVCFTALPHKQAVNKRL